MTMLGRRGLLKAAGLLPLAAKHKHKEPVPLSSWSNNNVYAQIVVVYGSGQLGLFVYNGQPALGNPPVAWSTPPGVTEDPSGNTLPNSLGGFGTQNSGLISQLTAGQILVGPSTANQLGAINGSAGGVEVFSGTKTAADLAAQLFVLGKLDGSIGVPVVQVVGAAMQLPELSSTPTTPGGSGVLYVDSTGHLHYLGPGGTNTTLAGP